MRHVIAVSLVCLLAFCCTSVAGTINFEGFADSTVLTTQYSGLTFSNALILTAGISLDEFEFPPHSGVNVVSDNGGPLSIMFATPITSFSAFFTYSEPLTIDAFNSSNVLIGSVSSAFSNNEALSGDSGSNPNEWLSLLLTTNISEITIAGDLNGSSFAMDDVTFQAGNTTVPEPSTLSLFCAGLIVLIGQTWRRRIAARAAYGVIKAGAALVIVLSLSLGTLLAQSVGQPTTNPGAVTVNVSTPMTVTSLITVPNVIAGSVNVLRIDTSGVVSIIGQLHDDGLNGDLIAGDNIYSGMITLNEPLTGQVSLKISVATKGSLRRTISNSSNIDVLPAGVPISPVAPDLNQASLDPSTGNTIIANEVLACFTTNTSISTVVGLGNMFNGSVIGRFSGIGNCYQFQLPNGSTVADVDAAVAMLQQQAQVVSAEPDLVRQPSSTQCNPNPLPTRCDPSYTLLNFNTAHNISSGSGVAIAVVDTGVDFTNPLFPPNSIILGPNETANPTNNNSTDCTSPVSGHCGHGTHVAGIALAAAPASKILSVKVYTTDVKGNLLGTASENALGIFSAANLGAKVINMSTEGPSPSNLELKVIQYARSVGRLLVGAAGNTGTTAPSYPGDYQGVISVGAVDNFGTIASFSNYGHLVSLAAPGVSVLSTFPVALSSTGTQTLSGTSQATPYVSGTAALLFSAYPAWTASQVSTQLLATAKPLANNPNDQVANMDLGAGQVDPVAALGAIRIMHTGLTSSIDFDVSLFSGSTAIIPQTFFTIGPVDTETGEIDVPLATLAPGTYTLDLHLDSANVTFGFDMRLSSPGVTFSGTCTGTNPQVVSPTEVTGTIFGFGFNQRSVICTIVK